MIRQSIKPVFAQRQGFTHSSFAADLYEPDGPADILPVFLQVTCIRYILATAAASAGQGVLGHCGEYFSPLYLLSDRLI